MIGFRGIGLFGIKEAVQLSLYVAGSHLISYVPKGLKSSYGILGLLLDKKTIIESKAGNFLFEYMVFDKPFSFSLKRRSSDLAVFKQIILEEEYKVILDLAELHGIELRTMVDAGANVGLTSIFFKAAHPNIQIYALEPGPDTFLRLENNVAKNSLDGVHCIRKGLWFEDTMLGFDKDFRDKEDWSLRLTKSSNKEVEAISVNSLCKSYSIQSIDFMKIDIEGSEVQLFEPPANLDWLDRVKIIAIEIHDEFNAREHIESKLKEHGFNLSYSGELTVGVKSQL